jgi:hypothetical protein
MLGHLLCIRPHLMVVCETLLDKVLGSLADSRLGIKGERSGVEEEVAGGNCFLRDVGVEGAPAVEHLVEDDTCRVRMVLSMLRRPDRSIIVGSIGLETHALSKALFPAHCSPPRSRMTSPEVHLCFLCRNDCILPGINLTMMT